MLILFPRFCLSCRADLTPSRLLQCCYSPLYALCFPFLLSSCCSLLFFRSWTKCLIMLCLSLKVLVQRHSAFVLPLLSSLLHCFLPFSVLVTLQLEVALSPSCRYLSYVLTLQAHRTLKLIFHLFSIVTKIINNSTETETEVV